MGVNEVRPECAGRACCPRARAAGRCRACTRDARTGRRARRGRRRRLRRRARVVEPEEARVDVSRAQRRQQLEDVSFRAAYSPDPLDVQTFTCAVPVASAALAPTTSRGRWPSRPAGRAGSRRGAVAHGAREHHRGERVVADEQHYERHESTRSENRAHDREEVHRDHVHGLDDVAAELGDASTSGVVGIDGEGRAPQHDHRLRREAALLLRLLAPEVEHELSVVALLRAFVDLRGRACEREVGRQLRPWRPVRRLRDIVDPAAAIEDLARRLVVGLPQRACSVVSTKQPTLASLRAIQGGRRPPCRRRRPRRAAANVSTARAGRRRTLRAAAAAAPAGRSRESRDRPLLPTRARARRPSAPRRRPRGRATTAMTRPSSTSRFRCMSCQTRNGCSVAIVAPTTPTDRDATRRPISSTTTAVRAATAMCAMPTTSQCRSKTW